MNISPDGRTVRFKTEPKELFEVEKSGAKPNTVRIIDTYEADRIQHKPPKKIIIQHQQEIFLRTLTDIHLNYDVLGKVIAIFSWTNEKHYRTTLNEDSDPKAHTMSLDDLSPILLPKGLIHDLGRHRRNRSHAEFISDLLDKHIMSSPLTTEKPSTLGPHSVPIEPGDHNIRPEEAMPPAETILLSEDPSIDKSFVAITVSKGTLGLLQSIAHGRSMNSVIKELYEVYMCTRFKEENSPHD